MAPKELEAWLKTEASKSVGQDSGDGEAISHKSGKKIIDIKNKKKDELSGSCHPGSNRIASKKAYTLPPSKLYFTQSQ